LAGLTVVLVYSCVVRAAASPLVRLIVCLVAANFMWIGFELVRAQLFTLVAVATLTFLALKGSRGALWLAVPLMGLWVNLHGGYLAGLPLLVGLCVTIGLEQRLGWVPRRISAFELAAVPVCAGFATLANPYGIRLLVHTYRHLNDPARLYVREWLPLWRLGELILWEKVALGALAVTALLAAALLPRRQLRHWALLGFALATSVSASRHLRLAPILLAPVVAASLEAALSRLPGEKRARLGTLVVPLAAVLTLAFGGLWLWRVADALRFIDYPVPSPANVIALMRANGLHGNVWNDYDWGGALIWADPASKIACDGRHGSTYSTALIVSSVTFGQSLENPLDVVTRYPTDMVLVESRNPAIARLEGSRFKLLYCDADACLLSSRPEHWAKAKEGLKLPAARMRTSDFFQHGSE
ncbi:MAG: hypothetical protein ACYC8T_21100, partial [Myxococcaceae bacterium]